MGHFCFVFQVLELGIVVHSVIIGISLGASESCDTIKLLMAALSFHQFFEGMGLGGCISQVSSTHFRNQEYRNDRGIKKQDIQRTMILSI